MNSSLADQKLKRHVGYDFEMTSRQHWFLMQLLILMFRSYLYYIHFLCHCQPKLSTYPRVWPPVTVTVRNYFCTKVGRQGSKILKICKRNSCTVMYQFSRLGPSPPKSPLNRYSPLNRFVPI